MAELQEVPKPSFWIDQQSVSELGLKNAERYDKFKAKNIKIHGAKTAESHSRLLVNVQDLSLGYDKSLFEDMRFQLREGESIELRGRNGAGKTTFIRKLLEVAGSKKTDIKAFSGTIDVDSKVVIGVYQQEVSIELFDMTLKEAIEHIYLSQSLPTTDTKVRQLLADYLFSETDGGLPVRSLSGGQKSRLQLISMLSNDPTLLILDEPTNHLDLPSIEELENVLKKYSGAILYVSHDSYFRTALGGEVVNI